MLSVGQFSQFSIAETYPAHGEGMLVAYLPEEKILIEADLSDSRTLLGHVQRLGLDVETIVPIHGLPVAWSDFVEQLDSGR